MVSGYIIGTITITALRVIFIRNKGIYEVDLKQKFDEIGKAILDNGEKIEDTSLADCIFELPLKVGKIYIISYHYESSKVSTFYWRGI